jgi:hypothetical protein
MFGLAPPAFATVLRPQAGEVPCLNSVFFYSVSSRADAPTRKHEPCVSHFSPHLPSC